MIDQTRIDRYEPLLNAVALPVRPCVGILIPTHNDGSNVGPLLERVLEEPAVSEVVVVASGCDDETVPIVSEVATRTGDRVRLYVEAERSGKASAVNFGLRHLTTPYAVVISGDVLPDAGAIAKLLDALAVPGVGLAGGRPVPVNDPGFPIGHAVHLLWRLHHRLAQRQPKLGEMIAIRSEAVVALPQTSVDEACFQAILETSGWRSAYVADAVVRNRGPETLADFVRQRRQIHTGHLWLRQKQHYAVPSLHLGLLAHELWCDLRADRQRVRPRQLMWTAGTVVIEGWARLLAHLDYAKGKEDHVWPMVQSTKGSPTDPDGVGLRGV